MLSLFLLACCALSASLVGATATLPFDGKIRGVNLGSLFVFEPWMAWTVWSNTLNCADVEQSEWACMQKYNNNGGSAAGDQAFQKHWQSWITESDITAIKSAGLNTVRIPLGFWIVESLVQQGEHFPKGGFAQLTQVLSWCTKHGISAMLVLHAAPGVQAIQESFAGRKVDQPEFYQDSNYQRAYQWATNITTSAYTIPGWESVFAIEAVNEPLQQWNAGSIGIPGLVDTYYPTFLQTVRKAEQPFGTTCSSGSSRLARRSNSHDKRGASNCLLVTYMDKNWGNYDPTSNLASTDQTLYDAHAYLKWNPAVQQSRTGYLNFANQQDIPAGEPSNDPVFVGEWSLSPSDSAPAEFGLTSDGATAFYQSLFQAEAASADKGVGWTYWAWKTQTGDPRWDYTLAVSAGIAPANAGGQFVSAPPRNNGGSGGGTTSSVSTSLGSSQSGGGGGNSSNGGGGGGGGATSTQITTTQSSTQTTATSTGGAGSTGACNGSAIYAGMTAVTDYQLATSIPTSCFRQPGGRGSKRHRQARHHQRLSH